MSVFDALLSIKEDFVIIDPVFPQKKPYAFRNVEINEYFKNIKNSSSYTMYPMEPGPEAWFDHNYGISAGQYTENKKGYLAHYPENQNKIHFLNEKKQYSFKLAYSFFLAETYTLLPFYEKNSIPFVFVLYPGGAFGLNNKSSDGMLRRIFSSEYFRGVITTQDITAKYLEDKQLCNSDKIRNIYGGFVQFKKDDVLKRKYYGKDKQTLDICFVAAKYSKKGIDKGYDTFIEVAKSLLKTNNNVKFHVVGGFDKNDIEIESIKNDITFYGFREKEFLLDFYTNMDIFLSPSRPYKLFPGNFDGFPLGIDAGFCGTALFVTDPLSMNNGRYVDGEEMIIINNDNDIIADKIRHYVRHPSELIDIATRGQQKSQSLFDIDEQVGSRLDFFSTFIDLGAVRGSMYNSWKDKGNDR